MQAGIPWSSIQEMPVDTVYLYRAFMLELQQQAKTQAHLERLGPK